MSFRDIFQAGILALLAIGTHAQTVTPQNWSSPSVPASSNVVFNIHAGATERMYSYPLVPSTSSALMSITAGGLQGTILILDSTTSLDATSSQVLLLQCDQSTTQLITPSTLFTNGISARPVAVILWSAVDDFCHVDTGSSSYTSIFTMTSATSSNQMIAEIQAMYANDSRAIGAAISNTADSNNGTSTNGTTTDPNSSTQPQGGTAIAMIILYAVTGIITFMFVLVIITGAIRAHRNPARYGFGGVAPGQPRQSRARGLARAMLESLPIVKVGDPNPSASTPNTTGKPTDVEMGDISTHGTVEVLPTPDTITPTSDSNRQLQPPAENKIVSSSDDTNVIDLPTATATTTTPSPPILTPEAAMIEDYQGCSICTDDFQLGEDQRVLPCDHRFHPACIDPWLLNVSGTCPLCRIDLRDNGKVEGAESVAPLNDTVVEASSGNGSSSAGRRRRSSAGRGWFAAYGTAMPAQTLESQQGVESLPREERLRWLREMRTRSGRSAGGSHQEDERGMGRRLRNVFRVRTRRIGEGEVVPEEAEEEQRS